MARRKERRKPDTPAVPPAARPVERLRPWLLGAAVALLVARPLFPSESPGQTGDGLPTVMLWIALAVVWMLGVVGRRRFAVRLGWTDAFVLALVAWHTLSALLATRHGSPRPAINVLWEWIGLGVAYFLARQFIATRREARAVVAVMIGLGVALAGYGLYQTFVELPETRAMYYRDADEALRQAGMWYPPGSAQRIAFERRLESVEPLATFALTNSLAGYLAPWLTIAAGIAVLATRGAGQRAEEQNKGAARIWIAVACCTAPMALCLLLTKSRSAYLAALVGLVALAAWWFATRRRHGDRAPIGWKRPAAILLAGAVLLGTVVTAATATGWLDSQVLSEASKSAAYRVQYWRSTLAMIGNHPLLGCGPGNFQQEYTRYKLPEASEEVADPHNFLLEVWATSGTPAMLALLAVLGSFGWTIWCRRDQQPADDPPEIPTTSDLVTVDRPAAVLIGGAAGFLLAIPLGMISSAPPGPAVVLLGLPLAAGCVALLLPWIEAGRLPAALVALGAAVLLVNLLAAGGIGFAGVAGTFWLMLALGLNLSERQAPRWLPWSAAVAGLVVALALAFTCHSSAYGPNLQAQAAIGQAEDQPLVAEQLLARAAGYDPLSAEPWRRLAALHLARWMQQPVTLADQLDRFEQSSAVALSLLPNSANAWAATAEQYAQVAARLARLPKPDAADGAARAWKHSADHYRHAVELYPNNPHYRAGLAEALLATGDREGCRHQAQEALRLDHATPHVEKKLPDDVRQQLSEGLAGQ